MRNYKRYRHEEMHKHIEACKRSSLSQINYCKQHGIAYSTFQYWAKKLRSKQGESDSEQSPGFIPVSIESASEVYSKGSAENQLHFLYPNGIQLKCSEQVNTQVLKTLINP